MDLGENGLRGLEWIDLAQDRDRWRAVVSAVINLQVLAPWSKLASRQDKEAVRTSETSINVYRSTHRKSHRCSYSPP
jgi:hypothetical protein